jgi:hypothetical protein
MTRPDYQGWLTDEDVTRLVKAMRSSHECSFSEEERQIIHDMAAGGKLFKKAIIYMVVGVSLWLLIAGNGAKKAALYLGWIK